MKYKYNNQWKEMNFKVSDTLPIGSIIDYNGETAPTGWEEVVDSGSNENGNWIKYDNGVMICWNYMNVTDQAINTQYGDTILYNGQRTVIFPQEFIESPAATCSQFKYSSGASWGAVRATSRTQVALIGYDLYPRPTGGNCEISWQAIGRWK